jgi:hypothetical protein
MKTYTINYKHHIGESSYESGQALVDFLSANQQYNYAGFVQFKDGIKIKGVKSESHFIAQYGRSAEKCFFVGRGMDTWNGIHNFGGRNWYNQPPIPILNPDNLSSSLYISPSLKEILM